MANGSVFFESVEDLSRQASMLANALISGAIQAKELESGKWNLTCNYCHHEAHPIQGTGNRYECEECGRKFAGDKHGF